MVASHEMYSFLDGFSSYHHIMIVQEDLLKTTFIPNWGGFCLGCHAIRFEEPLTHLPKSSKYDLQGILGHFHEVVYGQL